MLVAACWCSEPLVDLVPIAVCSTCGLQVLFLDPQPAYLLLQKAPDCIMSYLHHFFNCVIERCSAHVDNLIGRKTGYKILAERKKYYRPV